MNRDLRSIPLEDVLPLGLGKQKRVVTMGVGQWDSLLAAAYAKGWVLLELDENEKPIGAYQRALPAAHASGPAPGAVDDIT